MIKSKKKYKNKVKRMYVDFYIKDEVLYKYAQGINFQRFVKIALKDAVLLDKIMTEEEAKYNGNLQER